MRPKKANWQLTWAAGGTGMASPTASPVAGCRWGRGREAKNGYCPPGGEGEGPSAAGVPAPCSPQKLLRLVRRILSDRPLELAQDKMVQAAVLHGSPPTVAASSHPDGGGWRLRQAPLWEPSRARPAHWLSRITWAGEACRKPERCGRSAAWRPSRPEHAVAERFLPGGHRAESRRGKSRSAARGAFTVQRQPCGVMWEVPELGLAARSSFAHVSPAESSI